MVLCRPQVGGGRRTGVALGVGLVLALLSTWAPSAHADRATARLHFEQGLAAERAGEVAEALTLYQQAIAEDADFSPAYERATPLWMQEGAFDAAIRALEHFSLRHPEQAFAWYALAYAYRRIGRPEHAALSYESYIALRPQDATPYFGLGMVRLDVGDTRGARAAFETYVRMENDPGRAAFVEQARVELTRLGGTAGETPASDESGEAAEARVKQASVREGKPASDGRTASGEGETGLREVALLAAEGRHNEALARAATVRSEDPRERLRLALWRAHLLIATGRIDAARTVLWAILAAAPTHVAAYRMLADLSGTAGQ